MRSGKAPWITIKTSISTKKFESYLAGYSLSDTQLCSSSRIGPSRFRTRGLSTIREPTSRGVRSRPSSTFFCAEAVQLLSFYTEIYRAPVSCGGRKLLLRSYQAQARRLGPCTHFFHVVVKRQCSSCSLLRPTRILTSPSTPILFSSTWHAEAHVSAVVPSPL